MTREAVPGKLADGPTAVDNQEIEQALTKALEALHDADPMVGRDELRRLRRKMDAWQSDKDPAGLAQACRSSEEIQEFLDLQLFPLSTESPTDMRIAKAIKSLLYLGPEINTPKLVGSYQTLLAATGRQQEPWLMEQIAATLTWHAAGDLFEDDQHGRRETILAAEAAIRESRRVNEFTPKKRLRIAPLVSKALNQPDADLARLLVMHYGPAIRGPQLNSLLQVLAGEGELLLLAELLTDSLGDTPLDKRIGSAILQKAGQFLIEDGDYSAHTPGITALVSALASHVASDGTTGCYAPRDLSHFLAAIHRGAGQAVVAAVLELARLSEVGDTPQGGVDEAIWALALLAISQSDSLDGDSLSAVQSVPRSGQASDRTLVRIWGDLAPNLTLFSGAELLKILLLRHGTVGQAVRPSSTPSLQGHIPGLAWGVHQFADRCHDEDDFALLSGVIDTICAADCLPVRDAVDLLDRFPSNSPEFRSRELLLPRLQTPEGRESSEAIAASRAMSALQQGDPESAILRLAAVPISVESTALRLDVLRMQSPKGDAFVQDLVALCSLGSARELLHAQLDPVGLAAMGEFLSKALERVSQSARRAELNAVTNQLGFQVDLDGDWSVFNSMPMWLLAAWATALDARRRRMESLAILESCYDSAKNDTSGEAAQTTSRILALAALRCERYSRHGGGYSRIREVIRDFEEQATRRLGSHKQAVEDPADRSRVLSIYEQQLVATKKESRLREFARIRSVLHERYDLLPSAGIWTTVILGALAQGLRPGLREWLKALEDLRRRANPQELDGFFSARESAAIAFAFCRSADRPSFEPLLERLQSDQLQPFPAHAAIIRIVTDLLVDAGDIASLEEVRRIAAAAAALTNEQDTAEARRYADEARLTALLRSLTISDSPAPDIVPQILQAIRNLPGHPSDRQLDTLAQLTLHPFNDRRDSRLIREAALGLRLESSAESRFFQRLGALAATQLQPGSPERAQIIAEAGKRNVRFGVQVKAALDAPTLEEARDAAGALVDSSDSTEPMMTVSQFHVFAKLLRHELQAPGATLYEVYDYLDYTLQDNAKDEVVRFNRHQIEAYRDKMHAADRGIRATILQLDGASSGSNSLAPTSDVVRSVCQVYGKAVRFELPSQDVASLQTSMPEDSLRLVLHTLLRNALDAASQSTVVSCRWIASSPSDLSNDRGWLVISISNDGSPMPLDVIERIPEGRVDDSPELGGIGATLAHTNIRLAGGWMHISRPESREGTLVSLGLPIREGNA